MKNIEYLVGIPTRNREDMLRRTVAAFESQTVPPKHIVIVDNNDQPRIDSLRLMRGDLSLYEDRILNRFRVLGPEQGHQSALLAADFWGVPYAVRWDDDLIPEPDCMEKLLGVLANKDGDREIAAVGGMYPRPLQDRQEEQGEKFSDESGSGDGDDRHIQFFRWRGEHRVLERKHLYSSFAYDVRKALRAGGFCVEYSRFGQRGETDFTLRLAREGKLLVNTAALAYHHWSPGGRRMSNGEMAALAGQDNDLFRRRMIAYGIDPEGW